MTDQPLSEPLEVVAVLRLGDANAYFHVKPLSMVAAVKRLWIVRPLPFGSSRKTDNTTYIEVKGLFTLQKLWRTYLKAVELGRRPEVRAFVSFSAVPYGLIALLAARRTGKPVHIGFIGSDWNRDCRAGYARPLNWLLKKANLITVPGDSMKAQMVARGYDAKKIWRLPNAVDTDELKYIFPNERQYDVLFVGRLVENKRVDLILSAVARVKQRLSQVSLCIVGDGPLKSALEAQTAALGLRDNVVFAGYQADPNRYFSNARTTVIASDNEGLPFALVEAMAAGVVPIATNVGDIAEVVRDGFNGRLVPRGDETALAEAIEGLLGDPIEYRRLRQGVLAERAELGLDRLSILWAGWLAELMGEK